MRNIRIDLMYDGTNYYGWQIQPDKRTVQGEIKKNLELFLRHEIKLIGASRTDKGVHAKHQVANFKTEADLDIEEIRYRLNQLLDDDIYIFKIKSVQLNFHARYWAKEKTYRYYILNSEFPIPFYRNYSWFYPKEIDIELLNEISAQLIGKKDFLGFQGQSSDMKLTEREIYEAYWERKKDFVIFTITGSGFLKNMVRKIVGCLMAINEKIENEDFIIEILETKNRRRSKYIAPGQGLFLEKIVY